MIHIGIDHGPTQTVMVAGERLPDGRVRIINLTRRPRWQRVLLAPKVWWTHLHILQSRSHFRNVLSNAKAAYRLARLLWTS